MPRWTPRSNRRKTKEEVKAERERDRRPFRKALEEGEEGEETRQRDSRTTAEKVGVWNLTKKRNDVPHGQPRGKRAETRCRAEGRAVQSQARETNGDTERRKRTAAGIRTVFGDRTKEMVRSVEAIQFMKREKD